MSKKQHAANLKLIAKFKRDKAVAINNDAELLKFSSDAVTIKDGLFMEFGVYEGGTINFIAGLNPTKIISVSIRI